MAISHSSDTYRPTVTIWIHGTKLTPLAVLPNFFYRKFGLHPILTYDTKYHLRKLADCLQESDCENFKNDHFYVFGWSGKLSFVERKRAAQQLYDELIILCNNYKHLHGIVPNIRIISHSHGGNVALNLADVQKNSEIKVSELILLACPVQTQTMHLIQNTMFEKIYSFYSETDIIQIIDPQGLYKNKTPKTSLFSKREFPCNPKLAQIKTRNRQRGLMHIEFLLFNFVRSLPHILCKIKEEDNKNYHYFTLQLLPSKKTQEKALDAINFQLCAGQPQQLLEHQSASS